MRRIVVGKVVPYGKFTSLYVIAGPIVLLLLWIFVTFH